MEQVTEMTGHLGKRILPHDMSPLPAHRRPTLAVFAFLDPRCEHVDHPVLAKC